MVMTDHDKSTYAFPLIATSVTKNSGEIVREHCHLTGNFRGATHNNCNLRYQVPTFFAVVFHNIVCLTMIGTSLLTN